MGLHLLHRLIAFLGVVYHPNVADSSLYVEVGFACCIEAIFLIAFYLSRSSKRRSIWFYQISLELRRDSSIYGCHIRIVYPIRSDYKLMIIPKLPPHLRTDKIFSLLQSLYIQRAGLSRWCALGTNIAHLIPFFLQDYDSRGRAFIIWVLIDEFSLVLLINCKDILAWRFYLHIEIGWFFLFCLHSWRSMQEGGTELTDYYFTKKLSKILPRHVERSIFRVTIVIILISHLFSPFIWSKRPISLPYCPPPRIPQFKQINSTHIDSLQ